MKIILIGPTAPYKGGISHFNSLLYKYLSKKNKVQLISWKRRYPSFLFPGKDQLDKESKMKIKSNAEFILDSLNPFTWFQAFFRIKSKKSDLLIFHWVTPFMSVIFSKIAFLVKHFTKTKIVVVCHNVLPHERRKIDIFLTKLFFRYVDYFIVHSKEDLSNLKKINKNSNVKLGFHPTYEFFKFKKFDKDLKKELGLKEQVILFFGYVRKYKGLEYLIKAMPAVLKKIDCSLLVVGEFWEGKKETTELIKKLKISNNVKLVDKYVPNEMVGDYFSVSDVVVVPYITATQSGIVQLAFGFEKPVITTNVGGLPDVVENNKTGLLVPKKDFKTLADSVIDFFEDGKYDKFVKNIKEEKNKFSWDNYVLLFSFNSKD